MIPLIDLLQEIRQCSRCDLPLGPNPVLRAHENARVLLIGQAPGTRVHNSGVPWDDPSGDRLRGWLNMERDTFYDETEMAIVPMAFCYPGKGKSGDLPPPPLCSATWHDQLLQRMPNIELTLLIGTYAQQRYLDSQGETLTQRVQRWRDFAPTIWPLPHPSPRNNLWLKRNPWFERDCIPALRDQLTQMNL